MIDDNECGIDGAMRIEEKNRITRTKLAPVPFCPPEISHVLSWFLTRVAVVGSRIPTA
jgi:hypothetical protein